MSVSEISDLGKPQSKEFPITRSKTKENTEPAKIEQNQTGPIKPKTRPKKKYD